uniref:Uncharacterized protein n=1 Tax=uncultured marine virus TaxID=186617 RepID=A0A0F7L988_9VIRU|nr:hypothetical protein [uncultured marine virus]
MLPEYSADRQDQRVRFGRRLLPRDVHQPAVGMVHASEPKLHGRRSLPEEHAFLRHANLYATPLNGRDLANPEPVAGQPDDQRSPENGLPQLRHLARLVHRFDFCRVDELNVPGTLRQPGHPPWCPHAVDSAVDHVVQNGPDLSQPPPRSYRRITVRNADGNPSP